MAGTDGKHYMNKRHGEHLGGTPPAEPTGGRDKGKKPTHGGKHPNIHVHSHGGGHTVHVMHGDGRHEKHEHALGDAEGVAQHIHSNLGTPGQDHGLPGEGGGADDGLNGLFSDEA